MDYYLDPEVWFQANLKIIQEFPDIIFVPGWWMEYGMAAEPSILGAKIKFWQDNTPSEYHTLYRLEDIDNFPEYEVEADAFAAMTLHRIRMHKQRILDAGYILPMVTARGPLCTAGFVRGTTHFMIDLVEDPKGAHRLIDLCTRVIIDWLKAQHAAMGDTVEGIFILDDIVGFINEEHYKEFAHPYLKRICDAFPNDWVKLYHNDAEVDACLDHLPDAGFNVPQLGQAEGHPRGEAARRRSHVPDGQRQPAGDRRARHAGRGEGSDARRARGRRGARASSSRSAAAPAPACRGRNILAMLEALAEFNGKRKVAMAGGRWSTTP